MDKTCPITGEECTGIQCPWYVNIGIEGYQCAIAAIAYDLHEIASRS